MRKLFVALVFLALALGPATLFAQAAGQGTPPRVLTQATVDKFIADMPAITKEFNALAAEDDAQGGSSAQEPSAAAPAASSGDAPGAASATDAMTALRTNAKAAAILRRHGWRDSFWQVYNAVASGYFIVMMDEAYAQSKEPTMKQYADQYRASVNPADAALVARNRARLQQIFGGMGGE